MATVEEIADYIWRRSGQYGVNPATALGVARYEGLNPNTIGAKTFGNPDAKGYSFGPYQLYSGSSDPTKIAPGGMAYEFQQKFGQAPSRENWQQQVDFSLETMAKRGTSPWYAVRDRGGVDRITELGSEYARKLGLSGDAPATKVASADGQTWGDFGQGLLGGMTGGLLGKAAVPSSMGIDTRKYAAPAEPGFSGEAGKQVQAAATDYGFKDYSPSMGSAATQIAGLAGIGNALIAAGQPKQTWTPQAPAPVNRGRWRDDIFAGLLGL
jgi:hypothetical protein